MCQTSDTTAADNVYSTFVPALKKRYDMAQEVLREFLE